MTPRPININYRPNDSFTYKIKDQVLSKTFKVLCRLPPYNLSHQWILYPGELNPLSLAEHRAFIPSPYNATPLTSSSRGPITWPQVKESFCDHPAKQNLSSPAAQLRVGGG